MTGATYRAVINGGIWATGLTRQAADAIERENQQHDVRIEVERA